MTVAGGTVVKNPSASAGDARYLGSIPGSGRSPGEGNGNPFLPGKSHGQRSLVDYSPWGHKKSDMTEQLTLSVMDAGRRKKNISV